MSHCFRSSVTSAFFALCPFRSYKWQLLCFELSSLRQSLTGKRTNGVPWYDKHCNQLFLNSSSVVIQTVRLLIYTYTTVRASAPCGSHCAALVIRFTSAWFHRCLGGLHTLQVCRLVSHPGNYLYTVCLMTGGEGEPQEDSEKRVTMNLHLSKWPVCTLAIFRWCRFQE